MFAWANEQFERLSETIAPSPSSPTHRFQSAITSHNVSLAIAVLSPSPPPLEDGTPGSPLDPYETLNKAKGTLPIHFAAEHGLTEVVSTLIQQYGVSPEQFDLQGNTPLHYASSSGHSLALVQFLVKENGVDVTTKNAEGKTPYDISSDDSIRQYLLPIQLQKETQQCLDNGGTGLPQGIDMGGLSLNRNVGMGPPPSMATGGMGSPPPLAMHSNNWNEATAVGGFRQEVSELRNATVNPYPMHHGVASITGDAKTQPKTDDYNYNGTRIHGNANTPIEEPVTTQPIATNSAPSPEVLVLKKNTTSNSETITPPVTDVDTYARRGFSSAAVLPIKSKYTPDGFHSSSSDVNLQQKYGHDKTTGPPSGTLNTEIIASNLGPPPAAPTTAANSSNDGNIVGGSVGYNPYAGGYGTAAGGRVRYPTYNAVSNTVGHVTHVNATMNQYNYPSVAGAAPQYNVFDPAGSMNSSGSQQYPNLAPQYSNYQGHQQQEQQSDQFKASSNNFPYQGHQPQQSVHSFAPTPVGHQQQNIHFPDAVTSSSHKLQQDSHYLAPSSTHIQQPHTTVALTEISSPSQQQEQINGYIKQQREITTTATGQSSTYSQSNVKNDPKSEALSSQISHVKDNPTVQKVGAVTMTVASSPTVNLSTIPSLTRTTTEAEPSSSSPSAANFFGTSSPSQPTTEVTEAVAVSSAANSFVAPSLSRPTTEVTVAKPLTSAADLFASSTAAISQSTIFSNTITPLPTTTDSCYDDPKYNSSSNLTGLSPRAVEVSSDTFISPPPILSDIDLTDRPSDLDATDVVAGDQDLTALPPPPLMDVSF